MLELFFNGPAVWIVMFVMLFFWAPFALGAYLEENWEPESARRAFRRMLHPIQHARHLRSPLTH